MDVPARPPKPTEIRPQRPLAEQVLQTRSPDTAGPRAQPSFRSTFLESRTAAELQALLENPEMVDQIYFAEHPQPKEQAQHLAKLESKQQQLRIDDERIRTRVVELKLEVENALIETKELEREWENTELTMYSSLKPYTSTALHSRLQAATGEAEATTESLLSSFLEVVSKAEGDEVHDFVKEYRNARKLYHLRREHLARWNDGRVGGFR